ncbi:methyl-accepting chemotaxis protein [Jannaschia aquimarina]|uniref:Mcp3 protein n=1 Tax=Jannaschia aquimarina TaxID=935700 RepID=A0A0D1D8X7_9RHOB|nr:methyl-accepting chemotaxis protein [Jannaschia aquimarina]KIT16338.1 Methyl-accepting chemotaxis protein 3 [Jannaschia aquimarina]SNT25962.1 Methyl-accepting chemotaxis protein (MCP) signalling domain-containing protein [Jannaschia aquimarina]
MINPQISSDPDHAAAALPFVPRFEVDLDPDLRPDVDLGVAMRAVVTQPFVLRMNGMRMMMYLASMMLARDPALAAACREGLDRATKGLEVITTLYTDIDSVGELHPLSRDCLLQVAAACPSLGSVFARHRENVATCRDRHARGEDAQSEFERAANYANGPMTDEIIKLHDESGAIVQKARNLIEEEARRAQTRAMEARDRISEAAKTVQIISLNARVEAARAGEAGRTFGVIAQEIRELSRETEEAGLEIGEAVDWIIDRIFSRPTKR